VFAVLLPDNGRWDSQTHRQQYDLIGMGEKRNAYRISVGKPEGKRPLGRPRRRWVDNIKMDLREIGWDGMDWIDLAQDRDQWNFLSGCTIGSFSRRVQLHK
jgi:hypothetical protein